MMDYKTICEDVCLLAKRAGAYILAERKRFSMDRVESKSEQNFVSYVDKGAEVMIVERLREILPEAGFIAEEGTAGYNGEKYKWVIDPLDGTTNFIHGQPPFCTSIALMCEDEVVVGVIYDPSLDELYYAWQGSAAYLNGEIITVSKVDCVEKSLIGIGFSYNQSKKALASQLEKVADYQSRSNGVRRLGSAAIDMAYLACGRFDIFIHENLKAWDVAAGVLIALRAGAVITDFSGGDNYIFGKELVAANPLVYAEFMTIR